MKVNYGFSIGLDLQKKTRSSYITVFQKIFVPACFPQDNT